MSRFPFPIPHGWFGLCYSHELKPGEIRRVRFCGQDLAVFRTESGQAAALDNYCPHLGAPLSRGTVVGEQLRCPFHHWQFDSNGQCQHIPYAKRIPDRAQTEALPIKEINGMILAWYHPEGRPPYFDLDEVPGLINNDTHWGPLHYAEYDIPTCLQEISENDVDQAHFPYLHGMPAFTETETDIEGPYKLSISEMRFNPDFIQGEANSDICYKLSRRACGPGSVVVHGTGIRGSQGQEGEFILYNVATPVDDERTLLRWTLAVSKTLEGDDIGETFLHGFVEGVKDDLPIWEEKIYRENPVLCDGDGPIAKHRKWFSQFY